MTASAGVRVQTAALGVVLDGVHVLRDVDVTFHPGQITVVAGPSGSGKTTLLTAVAGLQPATSGTIGFAAADGSDMPRSGVRIGLVHQAFALLSLLSARENVELAAQLQGRRRADVLADASRCLDQVGLADRGRHLVEEMSGGEQQRVAIARALIVRPQVLLADEPTAQLDAAGRAMVLDLLRVTADAGVAVVVATHDPDVAARADVAIELAAGQVVAGAHIGQTSTRRGRHAAPAEDDG